MCRKTLSYGAEYFLTPCTYNNQSKFFEILLKYDSINVYFSYLTLFIFKLGATEVQDAAKKPNFGF